MKIIIIDDGFDSQFVETALFDGIFEIPTIEKTPKFIIPICLCVYKLLIFV